MTPASIQDGKCNWALDIYFNFFNKFCFKKTVLTDSLFFNYIRKEIFADEIPITHQGTV